MVGVELADGGEGFVAGACAGGPGCPGPGGGRSDRARAAERRTRSAGGLEVLGRRHRQVHEVGVDDREP